MCLSDVTVPLRLFVERPQFQVVLQLGRFLFPLLHCRQPLSGGAECRLDHLELLQARLVDVLLLHDVQLWERPQSLAGKAEPAELLSEVFSENINHSVVAAAGQCYIKGLGGGRTMWPKLRLFFVTAGWSQADTPDGMFSKSISQVHLTNGPWKTFGKGWPLKKRKAIGQNPCL